MRKWLWIGTLSVTLGSLVGYWYLTTKLAEDDAFYRSLAQGHGRTMPSAQDAGNAEESETIELLIVERSSSAQLPIAARLPDGGPMPRVVLELGMEQPPRPDAVQGNGLRMPYADEEELFPLPFDPVQRILDLTLPRLNLFEELKTNDPAEESETREVVPLPEPNHYHHHYHSYCPYGHCPAPIPYRSRPQD